MSKRYIELLKEALSTDREDILKTVDVKGPMVGNILSYSGNGEMKTSQDAASILERYYFKEQEEADIPEVGDPNEIPNVPDEDIEDAKEDIEDEIEGEEVSESDIESSVIEKLIREMEEEEDKEKKDDEEETLDIDKEIEGNDEEEVKEDAPNAAYGPGSKVRNNEDQDLEEAFRLFIEQVENEEDETEEENKEDETEEENKEED